MCGGLHATSQMFISAVLILEYEVLSKVKSTLH